MTIIAAYQVDGRPALLGDLLITGSTEGNAPRVAVPAAGDVHEFFGDSGWAVLGLYQKVALLGRHCAVAWAGDWLGARLAISHLKELSATRPLTRHEIWDYLHSDADVRKFNLSLVGLIREGNDWYLFHSQGEEIESGYLGPMYIAGSGSVVLRSIARNVTNEDTWSKGPNESASIKAIMKSFSLAGFLLQMEYRGGNIATTIMNMFGGGYEIAYVANNEVRKVDEITYVFWEADLRSKPARLSFPQLAIKTKYLDDHLFIRSVLLDYEAGDAEQQAESEQQHLIRPIFRSSINRNPEEFSSIPLHSPLFCHCAFIHVDERHMGVMTSLHGDSPSNPNLKFEREDGHTVLHLPDGFEKEFFEAIQREPQRENGTLHR